MEVKKALEALLAEQSIIIDGSTFEPSLIESVLLETGEKTYWVRGEGSVWLSIDEGADEITLFQDLDEDVELNESTLTFGGVDYELSFEGNGKVLDEEGQELDTMSFKEYEAGGTVIRVTASEVTGDSVSAMGQVMTEDAIMAAE